MADYIERQAAIDMFQRQAYDDWNQGAGTTWANAFSEAADMIEDLPSADVAEVVRCKDCKHSTEWYRDRRRCFLWCEDGISVFEDGFCSYGERKDG